jgi:hypothetical protein
MRFQLFRLSFLFITFFTTVFGQKTMDVSLKITYKGNPLCNWEITLKHGDVALGKAITDNKGMAKFPGVTILSKSVDAYGYKKSANGEKKWDVKGYIQLNDEGHADFDFDPLVKEMGMPGMIENAWGLTINDCGNAAPTAPVTSPSKTETTTTETEDSKNSAGTTLPTMASPAENNLALKQNLETKLQIIDNKLIKKEKEKTKYQEGSEEYSDAMYDIEDLKLEKQLTQLQLERTEKSISQNNLPLKKEDRDFYNQKEKELKESQKQLKERKKSGLLYGQTATEISNPVDATVDNDKNSTNSSSITVNTLEELNEMSSTQLKKQKVELNTQATSRKMKLKTGGGKMSAEEKTHLEQELKSIDLQLERINQVLESRKENE